MQEITLAIQISQWITHRISLVLGWWWEVVAFEPQDELISEVLCLLHAAL